MFKKKKPILLESVFWWSEELEIAVYWMRILSIQAVLVSDVEP